MLLLSGLLFTTAGLLAQSPWRLHGSVADQDGRPIAGASVSSTGLQQGAATADADGQFLLQETQDRDELTVRAPGFAAVHVPVARTSGVVRIVLHPPSSETQLIVTASRTAIPVDASANDTRIVSGRELREAPGFTLDDSLRQVPGFSLYRRTSSWVANPTSQGVSLRGLGSTAASRTLVLSDEIPLNDPFGGWVYWDEIPQLAVAQVEVLRGGASDLYGSSAMGGVINVLPVQPGPLRMVADGGYGGLSTPFGDLLVTGAHRQWSGLVAASVLRTGGYILTAPAYRGTVDTPYNLHSQSGRLEVRRSFADSNDVFLLGNVLNEARDNGTVLQTNATRLWRYAAGADWNLPHAGHTYLRLYGTDQHYRQSFSAIAANRDSQLLTDLQRVPSQQLGLAAQWAQAFFHQLTTVAGVDVHDVRASDQENPVLRGVVQSTTTTTARQRDSGVYGEALWERGRWSAAASGRVDRFRTFDALRFAAGLPAVPLPAINETVPDARIGLVRRLPRGYALTASTFRAFRGPTLNELYRNGQVGQTLQLANPALRSERATGWEAGGLVPLAHAGTLRASYFWTEVNRPITFLELSQTATTITEQRENLGQLRSRGVNLDATLPLTRWLEGSGGYQYADATVTRFAPEPQLLGNWLPEVARNTGTLQVRAAEPHLGTLNLVGQVSGRDYDNTENTLLLHGYFQLSGYYQRAFTRFMDIYGSTQNMLDRRIEAGRTPVLTLGTPRVTLIGIRVHTGD